MSMPIDLVLEIISVLDLIAESPTQIADVSIVEGSNHVLLQQTIPILNENPKAFRIDCVDALKGSLTLDFKLKTGGELDSYSLIGEVRVNIKELLYQIDGEKSYFTYPITGPSGEVTIGALKFSVEFKESMMVGPPNGPTLADTAGPSAGTPYMGPTHAQGYVSQPAPRPPPYPAPQPRRPSIVRRFATHLGLSYLVDLIQNGFDFDTDFDDVVSLF